MQCGPPPVCVTARNVEMVPTQTTKQPHCGHGAVATPHVLVILSMARREIPERARVHDPTLITHHRQAQNPVANPINRKFASLLQPLNEVLFRLSSAAGK